ncbi:MAG: hypothetical protein CUN52_04835 [Phototrophicales bacterium]|nr:MAG: hypothetical protein CUN52_04835 [Phototrophicales bacterium]
MSHISPIQQRLHITFGKYGSLMYIGSLDMTKVWERVLRRADLPIFYSQGFSNRPRIQVAAQLPLGVTSECELLDVSLREPLADLADVPERIMAVSPEGLRVHGVIAVPIDMPAPQTLIRSAEYRIVLDDISHDDLTSRIAGLLSRERIIIESERNGRRTVTDLRPMIRALYIGEDNTLYAHLDTGERGNLRPHDVLEHLGLSEQVVSVHRYKLHLENYEKLIKF